KWDEIYERNRQRAIMDDVHKIAERLERLEQREREALLAKMTPEERAAFYESEKRQKLKEDRQSGLGCLIFLVAVIVLSVFVIFFL
ncbi:MAG: hypothetical protein J6S75_08865, partial [Thermoguttaceae bacterium]|nr:hypothetical protein [Thermoguttaceae bacterium]